MNTLNDLSRQLYLTGSYDTALIYAKDAIKAAAAVAAAVKGKSATATAAATGLATAHNNIGNIYEKQGNYPEALKEHFASLKIREEIGDKRGIAAAHNNIGIIYMEQGNYPEALKEYFSALKTAEAVLTQSEAKGKNPSEKQSAQKQIVASHNNIGNIYAQQGNYPEALKEHFSSLKIKEEIGDKKGIATSHINIGLIYKMQGNYPEALKEYFSSLKVFEEIGDKKGIAVSHNNIGAVYIKQNKAGEGKKELETALGISRETGNKDAIKESYSWLSEADSALAATHPNPSQRERLWKSSLENYKMYIIYRDSLLNEENTKKSVQAQMQYEFDKKESMAKAEQEKKDAVQKSESRRQKIVLLLTSVFLILVLIFSAFIFRALRVTQKQKKVIVEQKKLVEEKQKEILDSIRYAKRIQDAILPTEKYIDKTFKRLNPPRP